MPIHLSPSEFTDWTNELRPTLWRAAARLCGPNEASDLVQETLLRAWQRLSRFDAADGPAKFRTWLFCLLEYVCRQFLYIASRHPEILISRELGARLESMLPYAASTEDDRPRGRALMWVIDRAGLSIRQRRCLLMYLDGRSQKEIARRLRLRQQTVAGHLIVAQRKLDPLRGRFLFTGLGEHWFSYVSRVTVYRAPRGVWDREGNAGQRERRRTRFSD